MEKNKEDKNEIYYCENSNREALLQRIIDIKNSSSNVIDREEFSWEAIVNSHREIYKNL